MYNRTMKSRRGFTPIQSGFTLIELIISISITLLLVGGVVSNYNAFNETQLLTQTALTLKNNFRLAQVKAVAVEKPSSGCTQLIGYRVTFDTSSYATQAQCTEGPVGGISSVRLPDGVTFSPIPGAATFAVLSGALANGAPVSVTLMGRQRSYLLQISTNGTVADMGLQ